MLKFLLNTENIYLENFYKLLHMVNLKTLNQNVSRIYFRGGRKKFKVGRIDKRGREGVEINLH